MGLMEKLALQAEKKRTKQMVECLSSYAPDLKVSSGEVICNENPAWRHISLKITPPSGIDYHFHRCRQVWFLGHSPDDLLAEELVKVDPMDPSTHESFAAMTVYFREAEPFLDATFDVWRRYFELMGVSPSIMDSKGEEFVSSAIEDARPFGMLENNGYGTAWLGGDKVHGASSDVVFKRLQSLSSWYVDQGVSLKIVADYWDKTPLEQNLLIASQNMLRLAGFTGLMQIGEHESVEAAAGSARSLMDRCLPRFSGASLIAKNDSRAVGAIPFEAYEPVLEWYLGLVAKKGLDGLLYELGDRETITELGWRHLRTL